MKTKKITLYLVYVRVLRRPTPNTNITHILVHSKLGLQGVGPRKEIVGESI